jgi:hypothetical protein
MEQVERLARQLPPQDQLKLVAHLSEQLSGEVFARPARSSQENATQKDRLLLAEELLQECVGVVDDSQGTSDAAATIRRMRDERMTQLCPRSV